MKNVYRRKKKAAKFIVRLPLKLMIIARKINTCNKNKVAFRSHDLLFSRSPTGLTLCHISINENKYSVFTSVLQLRIGSFEFIRTSELLETGRSASCV